MRVTDSEHIRLLVCRDCKTIEPLADYTGDPEHDHLLNYLVAPHRTEGAEHIGTLALVKISDWNDPRIQREISKELVKSFGGETGLGSDFYNTRDTFREDAMSCWGQHLRTPDCSDYKSDAKRLTPGTAQARKEAGMSSYRSEHDRYLCEFCAVHSLVMTKKYDDEMKKGNL
jgi:hypothetical protein